MWYENLHYKKKVISFISKKLKGTKIIINDQIITQVSLFRYSQNYTGYSKSYKIDTK